MKDSRDYFIKVKTRDIYFWCPFFEAFEGMLAVRTPSPPKGDIGVLHLMVSPDFDKQFKKVIEEQGLKIWKSSVPENM